MPIKRINSSTDLLEENETVGNKKASSNKVLWLILVILLVVLSVVSYNYFKLTKKTARLSTVEGQQEIAKKEIDELVKKVNKLIYLPQEETPTVATVTDAAGLAKTQVFYKEANNGDKVLIYFKAQKAYIYNPTKNILVNVGPVFIENNSSASSTSSANSTTEEDTSTTSVIPAPVVSTTLTTSTKKNN